MSDEDEQFQQRWGIRENDSDVDSSSDDQSKPSSVSEPKRKKHKIATRLFPDNNDQETANSPESHPEGDNPSSDEEPSKSCKKQRRKTRKIREDKNASEDETFFDESIDLTGYMGNLVEGVKVAREGLLKWMNDELEKSLKDDKTKKIQKRASKAPQMIKTPRSNQNKARKRPGVITQNPEEGFSEKVAKDGKLSNEASEVVLPANEPVEPVEKNQNLNQKQKGKRSGSSSKKQKTAAGEQQTANATAASTSASNYLTLPTVLPRQEPENSERTNSEGGNDDRDMRARSGVMNQSLNFNPRSQQKEGMFSQNGLRNVSDYEQNAVPNNGNIWGTINRNGNMQNNGNANANANGSMFPFGLNPQGLNGGIGIPNFPGQFGLQYLSQESILSGLRMNGGHPIMPNGNHGFNENFGPYNQQMRFKGQGGLMPLHSPENIRAANLQQR